MNKSLFSKYVGTLMASLVTLIEKINGKRNGTLKYYHKDTSILKKVYSADGKWESASVNTTYVAADFVSLDSPLPLKSRDALATANGKLPKIGISKALKESDIDALNALEAQSGDAGVRAQRIRKKLADDPVACDAGLDEKNEYNFLYALSHGYVGIKDEENSNALMRINYGYLDSHIYGASTKGVLSLSDIKAVINAADADDNTITKIWCAKTDFDALRQTREARELCANYRGQVYTDETTLPVPTSKAFQEAFEDDTNVKFEVVNRTIITEKNGKKTSEKPWKANTFIFVCSDQIGSLVYGTLAESTNPVQDVEYSLIDDYKLISKYSLVNPLREMTSGQAKVLPVIEDVDQIYVYDYSSDKSVEVDTTAEATDTEDAYITISGTKYTKSEVIESVANITGNTVASDISDADLITLINGLSDAQETALYESLTAVE